jgi:alpha-methylacyl-CoA racemase
VAGPLVGTRVIEFAGIGPCPFAAMLLADMGANVVRVDRVESVPSPDEGQILTDILRRGRRNLCVNLKHQEGVNVVLKLVERADVLLEGYRPGVMERLGVGPEVCLELNPQLIYGRVTGWGQEGPLAQMAGHDINYIAVNGVLHAIGRARQKPVPPLNLLGDFGGGGMLLAFGVVCALVERTSSGKGQIVDAAMIDGSALLMSMIYGLRANGTWYEQRGVNLLDGGAPFYDTYQCKDGNYISLGSLEPKFYSELIEILGLGGKDLADQMDRTSWLVLKDRFAEIFKTKTRAEWCEIMEGHDVCFAPVLSMSEAPDHLQLKARGTFIEVAGVTQPRPAPLYSRTSPVSPRPPCSPGEHTEEVLKELGFSEEEISMLRKKNTVA